MFQCVGREWDSLTPVLRTAQPSAAWLLPTPSILLPTGQADPTPSLDLQVLQALRDMAGTDAADVLAEVIASSLEDVQPRLQAIIQAVVDVDAAKLQTSAHALRSLSVTVGGIPVAKLCEALEVMGRAGITAGAEVLVQQLQIECERLEAALQLEHPGSMAHQATGPLHDRI